MKTINELQVVEINGEFVSFSLLNKETLKVESHLNKNSLVILKFGNVNITVLGSELIKAVVNAT